MATRMSPQAPAACQPLTNTDFERLIAARPDLWLNPRKTCITCLKHTKGPDAEQTFLWWADPERTEAAVYACDCDSQWLMHLWMLNAGIGLAYQRMDWEDVTSVPASVCEEVMAYAVQGARNVAQGRNLILWSPDAGTGKTLLMTLLIKALMAQGIAAYFAQFNDVIDLFTGSWRDEEERAEWDRRVRNVGVLAMDDIGKEHKGRSDLVESMVDQVIRYRVANSKPVFLTTNYTPEKIQQGYGGYVMSLLSEQADFIQLPGQDFRPRRRDIARREAALGLARPITVV